jgi:hypothetical protein
MQDINDIADDALNQIQKREEAYSEVAPFRVEYNALSQESHRVVHEQLSSMVILQRQVYEKSEELENLPELLHDDMNLDLKLKSNLNPNIFNQNETESISSPLTKTTDTNIEMSTEPIISAPTTTSNTNILTNIEPTISVPKTLSNENSMNNIEPTLFAPTTPSNENSTINDEPTVSAPPTSLDENSTINNEPTGQLTSNVNINNSITASTDQDEFEAGYTTNIQRRNPIIIATNNDRFVATVCCHENQLLYNDYNHRIRSTRLTLIPDITQPTKKQIIDWIQPEVIVGGGDDDWIQDIAYSTKLRGYLLLNRSRLRLFHDDTHELEEFYQFPDRSMKRVTCNETFIYLISAGGLTGQHGDEIILLNYDKEEQICKTFRDIVLHRNTRISAPLIGEISDLAVNTNGQLIFGYRLERRQEVGVCMYNITNNGNDWTSVKHLLLNECWRDDLSYTPRMEWCEKLNVFILIEHITSHLIMLDQTGQVKGETRFLHVQNQRDTPLNLSISTNDWFCVRYESSININRLDDDKL